MKRKKQNKKNLDTGLTDLFYKANSNKEKLRYFSKIQNYNLQMELLKSIPNNEKYLFIGKVRSPHAIAEVLDGLGDDETKKKTFRYVAKQFKGNSKNLLEILTHIDFDVVIPNNMLTFILNDIKMLDMDFLIKLQKHVKNYPQIRFKINERDDSRVIEYSYSEMSAIIAKVEELTADIPEDMDEAGKFFKVYSRITKMMNYDYACIENEEEIENKYYGLACYEKVKEVRRKPAGLYGGLIDGKAICAGYSIILHEALKYIGIKSQYIYGCTKDGKKAHAWNQVKIDNKWYNNDPTWDSESVQLGKGYKYMLQNDKDFNKTHGEYSEYRTQTEHKCNNRFDYGKIEELLPKEIKNLIGEDVR